MHQISHDADTDDNRSHARQAGIISHDRQGRHQISRQARQASYLTQAKADIDRQGILRRTQTVQEITTGRQASYLTTDKADIMYITTNTDARDHDRQAGIRSHDRQGRHQVSYDEQRQCQRSRQTRQTSGILRRTQTVPEITTGRQASDVTTGKADIRYLMTNTDSTRSHDRQAGIRCHD
jgi:hypothetical protein